MKSNIVDERTIYFQANWYNIMAMHCQLSFFLIFGQDQLDDFLNIRG